MGRLAIPIDFIKHIKYFWKQNMDLYINMDNLWGYLNMVRDWEEDGSVIIKEIFNWLILDAEGSQRDVPLLDMVGAEFDIYKHHQRNINDTLMYGWLRIIYYGIT